MAAQNGFQRLFVQGRQKVADGAIGRRGLPLSTLELIETVALDGHIERHFAK